MTATDLQEVANAVVRRAQGQGSVRPGEIRAELARLGVPEKQWKEIVGLAGDLLHYRRGRYYYEARTSSPLQEEDRQRKAVHQTVRELIRHYKKSNAQIERREQGRTNFVQAVRVRTDDERELTLLSRDLSQAGIRLIGNCSLLGHKVQVEVPGCEGSDPATFVVRILWTYRVGDGLFENGGTFLELVEPQAS